MEVDKNINKSQLINKLKYAALNNQNYQEILKELLNCYLLIETSTELNKNSALILILLLCISGNYQEANIRRNKYKNLNLFTSNEEFAQLFQISKRLNREPFIDIYGHINFFSKSSSVDISNVAISFKLIYEHQQAVYLSKFYSRIKISTLKILLGSQISEEILHEYLNKYGWKRIDDFVILSPVNEKFDSSILKDDLEFINRMTVSLENVVKTNLMIRPISSIMN